MDKKINSLQGQIETVSDDLEILKDMWSAWERERLLRTDVNTEMRIQDGSSSN